MRGRLPVGVVLAVALCALAGVALAGGAAATPTDSGTAAETPDLATQAMGVLADDHVGECAASAPSDYEDPDGGTADTVGWVEGYWYNEPVSVTPSDGFNQTELTQITKRTAARVEALRCLTYEEGIPPLETVTRDEYRSDVVEAFDEEVTAEGALYENAQMATRLSVGTEVDAIQEQIDAQTAFPAAFYDTEEKYMAFVSESDTVEGLSQPILAHELTHALQDQYFNLTEVFEEPTNDRYLSSAGVVESDADFTEGFYRENCQAGAWPQECIIPQPEQPDIPNYALFVNDFAVYNFPIIEATYDESGFEGVNDLFGNWPTTTTEAINPELYGEFERADLSAADQSAEGWRRLQSGNLTYNTVGQAGITAMFVAPTFETQGGVTLIDDIRDFQPARGEFDYGIPETQGWQNDRLYGYADGENQTAGVWVSAWETEDDATEFAETYESLIEHRDGSLADGYENVYTFEDSEAYDMAAAIDQSGDQVTIVTAPSIEELTAVHESVELQESTGSDDGTDDGSDDGTDDGSDDAMDDGSDDSMDDGSDDSMDDGSDDGGANESSDDSDDSGPGFGLLAGAVALLALALTAWRRR